MVQYSQFQFIQCHPEMDRSPKFLNGVWKHKMTEFGGNCLLKMIEEALAYRLLVMLLKTVEQSTELARKLRALFEFAWQHLKF